MPYILIFSFLLYAFVLKSFSNLSSLASALVVVLVPFTAQFAIDVILSTSYGTGIGDIVTFSLIATVIVQMITGYFIFSLIKSNDDDFITYAFLAGSGGLLLFLVVPNVVMLLFGG